MITLEDWALIRRLAAEGEPKAVIARRLGVSRTTVVKAVASDAPPRYERGAIVSRLAYGHVLVARFGKTTRDQMESSRAALNQIDTKLVGTAIYVVPSGSGTTTSTERNTATEPPAIWRRACVAKNHLDEQIG